MEKSYGDGCWCCWWWRFCLVAMKPLPRQASVALEDLHVEGHEDGNGFCAMGGLSCVFYDTSSSEVV